MTDLEKRAEEYAHTKHCKKCSSHCEKKCILVKDDYETFKDGAEFGYNKGKAETALLSQHILDLQKDKGNLTDKVRELEQQIEKMKNWCNCKNYQQCLIELAEQGKGMYPSECCRNCKKWEIKEK